MGFWDKLTAMLDGGPVATVAPEHVPAAPVTIPVQAAITAGDFAGMDDFIRGGGLSASGSVVTTKSILRNAAVYRCVTVVSNGVAQLPLSLVARGNAGGDVDRVPLQQVLTVRPNSWQTPFVFKRLMQHRVLTHGNAYAKIIRGVGGRTIELIPLDPQHVTVKQRDDLTVVYEYRRPKGGVLIIPAADMLHLMGPSEDGLKGMSLVEHAADTLGLSLAAQKAAARLFKLGVMAGSVLESDKQLSEPAVERLKATLTEEYSGSENSGKTIVLEEGLKFKGISPTPKDAQQVELMRYQIEEVARIFGVPRPFLMVDDTSWGSGIEQLGLYFVQYGLAPWFVCWEQAIDRACLTDAERMLYRSKFNERALLRGSMKDQAEFFAKALGAPGAKGWMSQDEVRDKSDLAPRGGGADSIEPIVSGQRSAA